MSDKADAKRFRFLLDKAEFEMSVEGEGSSWTIYLPDDAVDIENEDFRAAIKSAMRGRA